MVSKNKISITILCGFFSGFTLTLSGSLFNYVLASNGVDLKSIGISSLILLPYAFNFIWAPIFDSFKLGFLDRILGKRLSWLFLLQTCLAFSSLSLGFIEPKESLLPFCLAGTALSFFSSAQDSVLGALRAELVPKEFQGRVSGPYVLGYRLGMLLSGSGSIYFSHYFSWEIIFSSFALIIFCFPFLLAVFFWGGNLWIGGEDIEKTDYPGRSLRGFIREILRPYGSFGILALIVSFLISYRLPDNLIGAMLNPFFLHIGYSDLEIASAGKFFGALSAILGGFLASFIMARAKLGDSLLAFGLLHACAHSVFILQEYYGKSLPIFYFVTAAESVTGGMAMAAYIAFTLSICEGRFKAARYAFFSSVMGLSRSIFPGLSGYIAQDFGWNFFFAAAILAAIPSLALLKFSKDLRKFL